MTTPSETGILDDAGQIVDLATRYQTPDDLMVGTFLIGLFLGLFLAAVYAVDKYGDQLVAKGLTKKEYPFGMDYLVMIIIPGVAAAFVAYFGSGILLGLMDQSAAPDMVYYAIAAILGCFTGYFGWRFLKKLPDIIRKSRGKTAADAAKDPAGSGAQTATTGTKKE